MREQNGVKCEEFGEMVSHEVKTNPRYDSMKDMIVCCVNFMKFIFAFIATLFFAAPGQWTCKWVQMVI